MPKVLFVLNDPPYGSERSYNALRLVLNLLKQEPRPEIHIFLVGDAASCAKAGQETAEGFYNIERMLRGAAAKGAVVGVCGTCMDARGIAQSELVQGTRRSSLDEMTTWTLWAEKVLVF